ncbi:amino acid ABC transporter permease [Microvirga massiliensis]|uniref:amino acid ABC transporter permease n=1 Tax=Microvirga massiliensis TaxID=1033741 RepID=UPI00062BEBE8|nr:amino acid ABC transporter permease [Microvirga massiliensis]
MFDFTSAWQHFDRLAVGAVTTFTLSLTAILVGCPLGLALYAAKRAGGLPTRLAAGYISFFRGTPLLVQLLVLFYVPPALGIPVSSFAAAFLGLTLNTAAFQAEIYRAGYQSLPKGQTEAARALGLSGWQTHRLVLLPQVLRLTLPALTNEAVDILKNSALVSVIAVTDLLRIGQQVTAVTYRPLEVYITVAILYFVLTSLIGFAGRLAEQRFGLQDAPR